MLQGIPPEGDLSAKLKVQDKHVEATADCFRTRVQFPPPPPSLSLIDAGLSVFNPLKRCCLNAVFWAFTFHHFFDPRRLFFPLYNSGHFKSRIILVLTIPIKCFVGFVR